MALGIVVVVVELIVEEEFVFVFVVARASLSNFRFFVSELCDCELADAFVELFEAVVVVVVVAVEFVVEIEEEGCERFVDDFDSDCAKYPSPSLLPFNLTPERI
jgi:hypothetical protein